MRYLLIDKEDNTTLTDAQLVLPRDEVELMSSEVFSTLTKAKEIIDRNTNIQAGRSILRQQISEMLKILGEENLDSESFKEARSYVDIISKFSVPATTAQMNLSFWTPVNGTIDRSSIAKTPIVELVARGTLSFTMSPKEIDEHNDAIRALLKNRVATINANNITLDGQSLVASVNPTFSSVRFLFLDEEDNIKISGFNSMPKSYPYKVDLSFLLNNKT